MPARVLRESWVAAQSFGFETLARELCTIALNRESHSTVDDNDATPTELQVVDKWADAFQRCKAATLGWNWRTLSALDASWNEELKTAGDKEVRGDRHENQYPR